MNFDLQAKRFRNSEKFLLSAEDIKQLTQEAADELFDLVECNNQEAVKAHIKSCEGKHIQQIAYSSFHDALTQVCFDCRAVRTSLKLKK